MQATEAVDRAVEAFGDDFSCTVFVKPIDHYAVETGQSAQMTSRVRAQLLDAVRLTQTVDHRSHIRHIVAATAGFVRFDLENERAPRGMHGQIECLPVAEQIDLEQAFDGIRSRRQLQPRTDVVQRAGGEEFGRGQADHLIDGITEQLLAVQREVVDDPVAGERYQPAETLNSANYVDWFDIAGGQVHLMHVLSHRPPFLSGYLRRG